MESEEPRSGEGAGAGDGGVAAVPTRLLLPRVYEDLRRLAARKMAGESPGHTLQATALVHEAWMRLDAGHKSWQNQSHFFRAAAEAMRRILIDAARRKRAVKHGGALRRVDADAHDIDIESPAPPDKLIELDEALVLLEAHDARKAALVKLRYFAGLSVEEAAAVLGVSAPTAKRDWIYAKAWLFRKISDGESTDETPPPAH